jgi:hypothetical protein
LNPVSEKKDDVGKTEEREITEKCEARESLVF